MNGSGLVVSGVGVANESVTCGRDLCAYLFLCPCPHLVCPDISTLHGLFRPYLFGKTCLGIDSSYGRQNLCLSLACRGGQMTVGGKQNERRNYAKGVAKSQAVAKQRHTNFERLNNRRLVN